MSFFEQPILNSPYRIPGKHWELDADGRPTDTVIEKRRRSDLISAMPKPKSVKGGTQSELELSSAGLEGQDLAYNVTEFVNEMRSQVDAWRQLPNPNDWQVSPITQRLLQHWRAIQRMRRRSFGLSSASWKRSRPLFGWPKLLQKWEKEAGAFAADWKRQMKRRTPSCSGLP